MPAPLAQGIEQLPSKQWVAGWNLQGVPYFLCDGSVPAYYGGRFCVSNRNWRLFANVSGM